MNRQARSDAFYAADPRRARSPEADYGVFWEDPRYPNQHQRFTVSYIRDTGEVYALGQLEPVDEVQVLGIVPADDDGGNGIYYWTLERILEGWPDYCREPGLRWIEERIAAWRSQ